MKVLAQSGAAATLVRAADGARIEVANGTEIEVADGIGDKGRLRNRFMRNDDMPCLYAGELHFVDKDDVDWHKRRSEA